MLVKIFGRSAGYSSALDKPANEMQSEINTWLAANPGIRIITIKQSSNAGSLEPSKLWVSIWYELGT